MPVIKPFSPQMQGAVVQFLSEVFPESGKVFEPEGRHVAFADIDDEQLIGTVAVKRLSDDVCELKGMYIYKKYHRQGFGRRLAETAVNFAREMGFGKMVLDTVSTYENAMRLYEKLGFIPTERYNDNQKADVFMSMEL